MKSVFRIIMIGIAICTIAIPDMGSELIGKIKGYMRDLKDNTTDGIHGLSKGLGKSSAEKSQ